MRDHFTKFVDKLLDTVKDAELELLKSLVEMHDGYYRFPSGEGPFVVVTRWDGTHSASVDDVYEEVSKKHEGEICLGFTDENDDSYELSAADLLPGQISRVIEKMEAPFREGEKVLWNDPESQEYGEEEDEALRRVFTVARADNQQEILLTSGNPGDEGYTEVEAPACELTRAEKAPAWDALDKHCEFVREKYSKETEKILKTLS